VSLGKRADVEKRKEQLVFVDETHNRDRVP
jgi:hypothetical protein